MASGLNIGMTDGKRHGGAAAPRLSVSGFLEQDAESRLGSMLKSSRPRGWSWRGRGRSEELHEFPRCDCRRQKITIHIFQELPMAKMFKFAARDGIETAAEFRQVLRILRLPWLLQRSEECAETAPRPL